MPKIQAPWKVTRNLIVKSDAETDPLFGKKPDERPFPDILKYGVINLDKPPGPSSHEVASWVKKIISVGHIGHGGTLEATRAKEIPK